MDGVSVQSYVFKEATYSGATAAPSDSSLVPFEDLTFAPSKTWIEELEYRATHNETGYLPGNRGGTFRFSAQLRTGPETSASPHTLLIANAFGQDATTTSLGDETTVSFDWNDPGEAPHSLTLLQQGGTSEGYFYHQAKGCVVQKATISVAEGRPIKLQGEGKFGDYGFLQGALATGADEAVGQTEITMATDDVRNIWPGDAGLWVDLGTNDNSGAHYQITSVDYDNDTVTIDPAVATSTVSSGALLVPPFSAGAASGNFPTSTENSVTFSQGGFEITPGFISAELSIDSGLVLEDQEGTSDVATTIQQRRRRIGGRIRVYLEDSTAFAQVAGFRRGLWQINLRFGSSANSYRFTLNNCRIKPLIEIPFSLESGGVEVEFEFSAVEVATIFIVAEERPSTAVQGSVQTTEAGTFYLAAPDDDAFEVGSIWSVSFWFRGGNDVLTWTNNQPIVGKGINVTSEGGWSIGTNFSTGSNGRFWAETETPGNDMDTSSAFWGFNDGGFFESVVRWFHCVFVLDTTSPSSTLLYIDGAVRFGPFTSTGFSSTRNNNTQEFRIFGGSGNGYQNTAPGFSMYMTDMAVWGYGLSAANCTALYNAGTRIQATQVGITTPPLYYYTLRNLSAGLVDVMGNAPNLVNFGCVESDLSP